MRDGFHWTRITAKQLRFLYEDVTQQAPPPQMRELVAKIEDCLRQLAQPGEEKRCDATPESDPTT
jgi:hypothetical protein